MEQKNYNCSIIVNTNANETIEAISRVNEWWVKNTEGKTEKFDDVFVVRFNAEAFVTFKITEFEKDTKVVWTVTDCYLPRLKDKTEWNNTQAVFEISNENDMTKINFTHIGIVPEIECYDMCVKGWDLYVKGSLANYLNEGVGQPS